MKKNVLLIVLVFLGFSFASFAETARKSKPINPVILEDTENTENDDDEDVPSPADMKLSTPNFSLQGLQPANSSPTAQLQLTSSILTNSDLADTSTGSSANTNTIFFNGASLSAMPKLGETTRLSANINGGFIRYDDKGVNDYDTLNANLGLYQPFGQNMSGELGWRYNQYYVLGDSTNTVNPQDLQEQGLRLALKKTTQLPFDLFWDNSYEFQANFSDPDDRSRLSHYFTSSLGYNITNDLQGTLFYRLKHDDFTNRTSNDSGTRHEFQAQLSYEIIKHVDVAATVSYLFGDTIDLLRNSTAPASSNDLNNLAFGARIKANVPLLD